MASPWMGLKVGWVTVEQQDPMGGFWSVLSKVSKTLFNHTFTIRSVVVVESLRSRHSTTHFELVQKHTILFFWGLYDYNFY